MRRFGVYAAILTLTLAGIPTFSSQAAGRMVIVGGNCLNGGNGFSVGSFGGNTCGNWSNGNCLNGTADINKFLSNYFSNCPSGNWNNSQQAYFPNSCWPNNQNCQGQNQPGQPVLPQPEEPEQPTQPVLPQQPEEPSNGDSANRTFVQQIVELVNEERAKAGLSPLQESAQVSKAASVRAQEIIRSFSHTRPDGSSFSTVLQQNGISYRASGENIAYGQRTPQEVMNAWMNSQGHRANILNANFTTIGVGYVQNGNGTGYWTQLFVR